MAKKQSKLEAMKLRACALQNEIWKLEEREAKATNASLVGRCFKYHNSYSSDERWWMYFRVDGVTGAYVYGLQFQTDSQGRHEIQREQRTGSMILGGSYIPIDRTEFNDALKVFMQNVEATARESR